jgi:nicotinamidase/pyrazinamidase
MERTALIVVDAQYDFMPGGSLAVPNGDEIVAYINSIVDNYALVLFTKDYHPKDHCSFLGFGGQWPEHCVVETEGAKIHSGIRVSVETYAPLIYKGVHRDFDSYSGFCSGGDFETKLREILEDEGITSVDVCGLATDYCVKATVLDALKFGLGATVLIGGCRGITQETSDAAIKAMVNAGAKVR